MNEPPPLSNSPDLSPSPNDTMPSPWRCWGGSVVAGGIAVVLYRLTQAIALSFASKVIHSDNVTTQRISAAVRTLVVGLSALGTGIFALAALGLFGLGIQLWLRRGHESPPAAGS